MGSSAGEIAKEMRELADLSDARRAVSCIKPRSRDRD